MQFPLTKIFIKKSWGGFHDKYETQRKVTINPGKTLQHRGQGLSPGWMVAASWQAAYVQGLADYGKSINSSGQRLLQSFLSLHVVRYAE